MVKKSNTGLQFLLLIIPFFKLTGFSQIASTSKIFDAWFMVASAVILYKVFFGKYSPSKIVKVCSVLQLYLFISTVIRGGFSTNLIRNTIGIILIMILVDMYININRMAVYKSIMGLFFVYSILNFFIKKGSIFGEYLFGARTNLTTVATPIIMTVAFIIFSDIRMMKQKSMLFMAAAVTVTNLILIFREAVSTAIIAIAVAIIFYMLFNIEMFRKVNAYTYILAGVVYNFIIVTFQSFGYLKAIFNLLGENMTMTGRLLIWSNTITAFLKKPIFGYGVDMQLISRGGYSLETTYVHNNFLQFCMDGGIIALILFVWLLLVTVKDAGKLRTMQAKVVLAMNMGLIIAMISEAFTSRNFYYVLLLLMARLLADAKRKSKYMWEIKL